jgi:hypothetical protein
MGEGRLCALRLTKYLPLSTCTGPGGGCIGAIRTGFITSYSWFDRARPEYAEGFTMNGFSVVLPELA